MPTRHATKALAIAEYKERFNNMARMGEVAKSENALKRLTIAKIEELSDALMVDDVVDQEEEEEEDVDVGNINVFTHPLTDRGVFGVVALTTNRGIWTQPKRKQFLAEHGVQNITARKPLMATASEMIATLAGHASQPATLANPIFDGYREPTASTAASSHVTRVDLYESYLTAFDNYATESDKKRSESSFRNKPEIVTETRRLIERAPREAFFALRPEELIAMVATEEVTGDTIGQLLESFILSRESV